MILQALVMSAVLGCVKCDAAADNFDFPATTNCPARVQAVVVPQPVIAVQSFAVVQPTVAFIQPVAFISRPIVAVQAAIFPVRTPLLATVAQNIRNRMAVRQALRVQPVLVSPVAAVQVQAVQQQKHCPRCD